MTNADRPLVTSTPDLSRTRLETSVAARSSMTVMAAMMPSGPLAAHMQGKVLCGVPVWDLAEVEG